MTIALPKAIDAYFAGSNAHAPAAIAEAFAVDGVVHDEGKTHRGRAAITAWARETIDKYRTALIRCAHRLRSTVRTARQS